MQKIKSHHSPYGTKKFESIDQYHAHFPEPVKKMLDQMRKIIRKAAPKAIEAISYQMPAFKMNKVLVYYAANAKHIGFYPTPSPIQAFANELSRYQTSRGAIQFPLDQPLPEKLIYEIVRFRLEEEKLRSSIKPAKTPQK
jgi:uncharacterized protein YdhG (YjbR/CyaY superfamily)